MRTSTRRWMVLAAAMIVTAGTLAHATPRHRQSNYRRAINTTQVRNNQQPRMDGLQARIDGFIRQNQLKTFTKHGKKFVGAKRGTNMDGYKNLGKNMVEFFVRPGFHHLYTRVPSKNATGQLENHVYSRISGLSKSKWYPSSSEQISVLCELTNKEMSNLNGFLGRATANPSKVIGRFVYGGGRPPTASNCTSYITTAKIGERGESLARILGVYESGMPQGFLRSLISRGNSRVKAVIVQNPTGNFDQNYDMNRALR